ncbi:MAG: pyridoxamine 5'-phosphate oxidase [Myxococcota bacterium]|nr:pyridoxamine 5'-phosphate oxidase [Myxococcota bacterium]
MIPDPDDLWIQADPLPTDPFPLLSAWLDQAFEEGSQRNPHAIALATLCADGRPTVRMVLCKRVESEAGAVVFYTDRSGRKSAEIEADARVALVFSFAARERQVRIEGRATQTDAADSDAYFASRPRGTQLAAHASRQSQPLRSRHALEQELARVTERFPSGPVPRPPDWGGFRVVADRVELWRGRPSRLHDRASYRRIDAGWEVERLQP